MGRPEKVRLGEILVQQRLLTQEQLKSALDEQKKSGRRLGGRRRGDGRRASTLGSAEIGSPDLVVFGSDRRGRGIIR